jgi:chitinase
MSLDVRIGYYRADSASSACDATQPENLAAGALTHINVGYEYIDENGLLTDVNGAIMARTTRLKRRYQGLRVNLVVGGYDFSNPNTQDSNTISEDGEDNVLGWSNMTSSVTNQQAFITSLMSYMDKYAVDGVDFGKPSY